MVDNYERLALFFKALSDETRVKILHMLADGELCACKILEEFQITQPTLSYHMKIMSDVGLVNSRKDGVWMRYTINKENLEILKDFLNAISVCKDNDNLNIRC